MAQMIEITDLAAPELSPYARLTEAQLRAKRNPEAAMFIAESRKVIEHGLDAGYTPVSLLMERQKISGTEDLLERCGDVPVYTADRELLAALTGYQLSRGILCAMRRPAEMQPEEICRTASRVAVLEGIFRSAAALGMDAVLLSPNCCDPLHRRAVRVSMGTVFQIPWARLAENGAQWPETGLRRLKTMDFSTAAMALDSRAVPITAPELKKQEKLAIFLGTEGDGLSPAAIAGCDYTVMIPMYHGVDSLNVAAASAVAFWELRK